MRLDVADAIAADLVRAVRGRRTQAALSRAMGYRSNIVRRWEAKRCFPTAATFLTACARLRPMTKQLFVRFFKLEPTWHDANNPFSSQGIAAFLRELRGRTPIGELAGRTDYNRYQVARWLTGKTQPKLPEFLALVEAASRRSLDFIAGIADPSGMPTVGADWRRLSLAREAAYGAPWSHAVLHALELDGCAALQGARQTEWLAACLGLPVAEVEAGLSVLAASGQIRKVRGAWRPARIFSVDTSHDAARARALKVTWSQVAVDRMRAGAPGSYGYSVFAVSRKDLARVRDLQLEYVRAMQSLISASRPGQCVGLYCSQLLDLASRRLD
jgi:transcriptional regulator with XRE-family HTH domain